MKIKFLNMMHFLIMLWEKFMNKWLYNFSSRFTIPASVFIPTLFGHPDANPILIVLILAEMKDLNEKLYLLILINPSPALCTRRTSALSHPHPLLGVDSGIE